MDAAANDLNSYYKATEWAMLHFHKEKMREINTIIRELWRQIYRGTDIDYIEIKTDVPEQSCKFSNYCTCILQPDKSNQLIQTVFLKINFCIVS
jgi:DNA repair protein RAD50